MHDRRMLILGPYKIKQERFRDREHCNEA